MAADDCLDAAPIHIRTRQRPRIQQDLLYIFCKNGAIPPSKVKELVTAHPQALHMERRKGAIDFRDPLRHAVIVSVFGLEGEIQISAIEYSCERVLLPQASVRAQAGQRRAAF